MAYLTAARAQREPGSIATRPPRRWSRAIDLVEAPRAATVGAESERAEYFSQFVAAFDLLVDWSVAEGDYDKALAAAEQGRNRTFLDQMRAAGVDLRPVAARHAAGRSADARARRSGRAITKRWPSLRQAYARTRRPAELKETVARIETPETGLRSRSKPTSATPARSIATCWAPSGRLKPGTKSPRPFWPRQCAGARITWGTSQSHLFVIDGRSRSIKYFPLTVADNAGRPDRFSAGPADALGRGANWSPPTWRCCATRIGPRQRGLSKKTVESKKGQADLAGRALSTDEQLALAEIVLPPAAREHIDKLDAQSVIVVPDGALDQLPLESLLLGQSSRPAICSMSFRPSPMLRRPRSWRCWPSVGPAPPRRPGLAVDRRRSGLWRAAGARRLCRRKSPPAREYRTLGGLLTPLPGTLAECRAVEQAIATGSPGADVVLLCGAAATEGNVRAQIGNRRFVHLAAHGLIDQRYGNLFGAIALTPPAAISFVRRRRISVALRDPQFSLPGCELVVLSSCETKVGADRPLEAGSTLGPGVFGGRECGTWFAASGASTTRPARRW